MTEGEGEVLVDGGLGKGRVGRRGRWKGLWYYEICVTIFVFQ